MTNMMAAYRLATAAGIPLPPIGDAPPIPQEYIDQADAIVATPYHEAWMKAAVAAGGVYMFDSTNPQSCKVIIDKLGPTTYLVGSYVDGYGGYAEAVSLFGASRVVSISVNNNDAMCADVEPGAMSVSQLPGWRDRQVARGIKRPVAYSNGSQYPACLAAVGATCSYWTATASGQSNQVLPGRDAVQDQFDGSYDESWVLPTFPFYPGGTVPPSNNPWPLGLGATGPNVVTLQGNLNKWKFATPPLAQPYDGSFGPLTKTAVQTALTHWHYSAAKVAAAVVDEDLWNYLKGSPVVTPPPGKKTITGVTVHYSDGSSTTLS